MLRRLLVGTLVAALMVISIGASNCEGGCTKCCELRGMAYVDCVGEWETEQRKIREQQEMRK